MRILYRRMYESRASLMIVRFGDYILVELLQQLHSNRSFFFFFLTCMTCSTGLIVLDVNVVLCTVEFP